MTKLSFSISAQISEPSEVENFISEIEMICGPCAPLHKSKHMLDSAPGAVKESASYQYWKGVADAHQVHLYFGGVEA
ncbi:MAG: hypothetical protein GY718_09225 [Lentisphaerae bacterium]|nr:hypothetical protein [Lentisphaerota bacterium]